MCPSVDTHINNLLCVCVFIVNYLPFINLIIVSVYGSICVRYHCQVFPIRNVHISSLSFHIKVIITWFSKSIGNSVFALFDKFRTFKENFRDFVIWSIFYSIGDANLALNGDIFKSKPLKYEKYSRERETECENRSKNSSRISIALAL